MYVWLCDDFPSLQLPPIDQQPLNILWSILITAYKMMSSPRILAWGEDQKNSTTYYYKGIQCKTLNPKRQQDLLNSLHEMDRIMS